MDLRLADDCANLAEEIRVALQQGNLGQGDAASVLRDITERVDATIARVQPGTETGEWELTASGLRVLASHEACLQIAQTGVGSLLEERSRGEILAGRSSARSYPRSQATMPKRIGAYVSRRWRSDISNPAQIRALLASIPLPTLYWSKERPSSMLAVGSGESRL